MDGNRRYGQKRKISDIISKKRGFDKMIDIAKFCSESGIKHVSFFAFSLANFKRSENEIKNMMDLIVDNKSKLEKFSQGSFSPKIKFYGRLDRLKQEILNIFNDLEDKTDSNTGINMNIFFAYSSLDEIKAKEGTIRKYDKRVDILIRTSGEKRLSDFLLSQSCNGTSFVFCKSLWPELSIIHLYFIILKTRLENNYINKLVQC